MVSQKMQLSFNYTSPKRRLAFGFFCWLVSLPVLRADISFYKLAVEYIV